MQTVSNSPNPSRVCIRLCKHGKRFLLLNYKHKDIAVLRQHINTELKNLNRWLRSDKLSLNIEKSSYVIFHPSQKKISDDFNLVIDDICLKKKRSIKYLGVFIDSNLS